MTLVLKPGPKALAAAFMLAGWSNTQYQPDCTDQLGHVWDKPSTLLVALAVCGGGESAGDALATRVDFPGSAQMSTDYGLMQINDHYNEEFWQMPSKFVQLASPDDPHFVEFAPWDWQNPVDNAWAAFQIYVKAGHKFTPWHGYTGGGWLKTRWKTQTWLDWANVGINQVNAALKAGATLPMLASVDNDPL